jgi:hypothetical protein
MQRQIHGRRPSNFSRNSVNVEYEEPSNKGVASEMAHIGPVAEH